MSIKKINEFPFASGVNLTPDDIFLMMDDPSGSAATKKVSLSTLSTFLGGGDTGLQTALDLKAPLASPTFTGNIYGPGFTATSDTNSERTCFYGPNSLIMTSGTTIQFAVTPFGIVSTGAWMGTAIEVAYGGTGATTVTGARTNLEVDNNYITPLGSVSGSRSINYDTNRSIQTLTLDGSAITFTKGTGWPTSSSISVDTVLRITVTSATSITWTIVNDWFAQPPAGALGIGTHLVLLRAIGTSIIEGHYIGSKTN